MIRKLFEVLKIGFEGWVDLSKFKIKSTKQALFSKAYRLANNTTCIQDIRAISKQHSALKGLRSLPIRRKAEKQQFRPKELSPLQERLKKEQSSRRTKALHQIKQEE